MKILCIANNLEGNYDGIGKHARIVGHEFVSMGNQVDYCTGTTWNKSKIGKMLSFQMCNAFLSATWKMMKSDYDYIVIEYPFAEYNPFILLFHWIMFFLSRFTKTRVAFSMHEYDRVSSLRRTIIKGFLPFCDVLFVSEEKYFRELSKYRDKMFVRTIPSHGLPYTEGLKDTKEKTSYCYFGLVNRSKVFLEMLNAWDVFNKEGKFTLDVVSISDLAEYKLDSHKNVTYHYKLADREAGAVLSKDVFSIIPVVPSIGYNNSSFVSSIQCGCIPIGKFNNDLSALDFIVKCNSYELNDFVKALYDSQNLSDDSVKTCIDHALEFGKNFSVHKTAEMMINGFKAYESKHKK